MSIDRTNFNALVDDDGTNTTGSIWNKNQIKNVLLDPIDAFVGNGGLWTPYAPVWAGADGFGPVLGNGTLSGRFLQIGNWIDALLMLCLLIVRHHLHCRHRLSLVPFGPCAEVRALHGCRSYRLASTSPSRASTARPLLAWGI